MRNRWALWVLLASALTVLTSLYLPWKKAPAESGIRVLGLLHPLSLDGVTGWASGAGDAAALAALALAAATVVVLARPLLADRMPLLACALLTAYLAIAGAALLSQRYEFDSRVNRAHYPWAYGAYLGLAACLVAVLAAAAFSRAALVPRGGLEAVGWIIGLGLLVSFLLPWHRVPYPLQHGHRITFAVIGATAPGAVLAAALVVVGGTRRRPQALCWVGAAVFTFGAFGLGEPSPGRAYGFWVAFAFALALLAVASVALREWPRPARPGSADATLAGAAAVFVVSLFLPWERLCAPHGLCVSETGWTLPGSSGAMLAGLVGLAVLLRTPASRVTELAAGTGLLVATAGFAISQVGPGIDLQFAYGAIVGFSATALLLALAAGRFPRARLDRVRLLPRLIPIAASLALLAGVALPWWAVLPSDWTSEATVLRGWFGVAGLLLSLDLLSCWLRRTRGSTRVGWELMLLPLAVLALVALVLILQRDSGVTWGGGILVGLCLLLSALGWIEAREGLENLGVPEVFRIDRLPGAET
jgi:hypothetical protein